MSATVRIKIVTLASKSRRSSLETGPVVTEGVADVPEGDIPCIPEVRMNLRKMRVRSLTAAVLAVGTAFAVAGAIPPAAAAATGPQPLTPQLIAQLSQGPRQPVIVLLKNQHPETPPNKANDLRRAAVTQNDQRPMVDQVRQTGASHVQAANPSSITTDGFRP